MSDLDSVQTLVTEATAAVDHAQATRRFHARRSKPGTDQREADVDVALDRLRQAMEPLRAYLGRIPYRPVRAEDEVVRQASLDIQRERRKLWKLKHTKNRRHPHDLGHQHR